MTATLLRRTAAALATLSLSAQPVLAAASDPPPLEDLLRPPNFDQLRVSPSGRWLSTLRIQGEEEALAVLRTDTLEPLSVRHFGERTGIADYLWVNDERLLLRPARRFLGVTDAKVPTGEIIGIDHDGRGVRPVFGYNAGGRRGGETIDAAGRVIDRLPEDERHVIVQSSGYEDRGTFNEAWRMDVRDGGLQRLAISPLREGTFVTDTDGAVVLVTGSDDEAMQSAWYRPPGEDWFEEVANQADSGGELVPLHPWDTDADGDRFLAWDATDGDTRGISAWNPATGDRELLFRHPAVDAQSPEIGRDGAAYAVRYVDHYPKYHYLDPQHPDAVLHRQLRGAFPQQDVSLVDFSADGTLAVALVHSPRDPGTYYLVDTTRPAFLHKLPRAPWIDPARMAPRQPVAIETRDGVEVRGYLTEPARPEGAPPPPLVVRVHGGPHGVYDTWAWDAGSQVLASRGYAVLQVNFRGSGGRGTAFETAGHGGWGTVMQDDVTDAVRWAIDSGTADPDRLCIMGGSYGAYSALVGVVREPDLYRCAVGIAGVYDLELMFGSGDLRTNIAGQNFLERVLGDDTEELRRRSPVHNAERIEAAVLLAHGELDRRAPIAHAERMRDALEAAGNEPVWIYEPREGHGFFDPENVVDYWSRVLAFLDAHIGAGAGDAVAARSPD
jgi:dipeptidyl aminopeptidase/acylaminoacyl peptidase